MEGTWRRATSYINLYFLYVCESVFIVVAQAYLYLTLFLLTITNNNKECLYNLITTRPISDQDVKRELSIYKSMRSANSYSIYVNKASSGGTENFSNLSRNNKTVLQKNLLNINVMTKRNYSATSYSSKFITSNKYLYRAYSTSTNTNTPVSVVTLLPVKKYENTDLDKLRILKENKEKAGVYR